MTDCTAKVTTADVTDEVVAHLSSTDGLPTRPAWFRGQDLIPDGETVQRQGDRLVRVGLHPHECSDYAGYPTHHTGDGTLSWTDDTPGTTPHADDVTVSDAEVEAFINAETHITGFPGAGEVDDDYRERIRHCLLAAKHAEKEQA